VIIPLVNVVGLCIKILVVVLSHCIVLAGTGKILGVGFTVTDTVWLGPSLQAAPLTGVTVYVTVCGESVWFINVCAIV
jgi:hypothetical protein